MNDYNDPYTCPVCKSEDCVPAFGYSKSQYLIIGEEPGHDEIKKGKPFTGATGGVLRTELGKLGLDMQKFRVCNLWLHPKSTKKDNSNKECLEYSVQQVIKEAKGKKAILLIGSETVKFFCNKAVSNVTGLKVTSPYLSAPLIMACVQPATAFHGTVGELRLSLEKFVEEIKKL